MSANINLCTAVLPGCSFEDVLDIGRGAGYQGIELRVDAQCHKSLENLQQDGVQIRRAIEMRQLQLSVLSSYIPLDDRASLSALLGCCRNMGVPKARVVLPRSCQAAVARQARTPAIIPSYDGQQEPRALLASVRTRLRQLEREATAAGVQLLLELHWGTIMSSFSSAYYLTGDLDPSCIAITFDPANMLVEGKEDWEFGIKLIQTHLANVHVKNMSWSAGRDGWAWDWAPLAQGMVDWPGLLALLQRNGYRGDYAIEDFLAPGAKPLALPYLSVVRAQFGQMYEYANAGEAPVGPDRLQMLNAWDQPNYIPQLGQLPHAWQCE